MSTIVDFGEWSSAPGFTVKLGGGTYEVPPRNLDDWGLCAAAATLGEYRLGFVKGDAPASVLEQVARIKPGDHPALGPVYNQMIADGLPQILVDRVAYYAVFLVARGKEYADALAGLIWADGKTDTGEPAPKG